MKYTYSPKGVCSREIILDIDEGGIINDVKFVGGCHGNLQGISALVKGILYTSLQHLIYENSISLKILFSPSDKISIRGSSVLSNEKYFLASSITLSLASCEVYG